MITLGKILRKNTHNLPIEELVTKTGGIWRIDEIYSVIFFTEQTRREIIIIKFHSIIIIIVITIITIIIDRIISWGFE